MQQSRNFGKVQASKRQDKKVVTQSVMLEARTTTTTKSFPTKRIWLHGSNDTIMSYQKSCLKTHSPLNPSVSPMVLLGIPLPLAIKLQSI